MECVVCAESLHKSISACIPCGHVFHLDCLGTWLTDHKSCPMCREEYDLTDMQTLFLPENENRVESDEEIKRKWGAYTNQNKKHKSTDDHVTNDSTNTYNPHTAPLVEEEQWDTVQQITPISYQSIEPAEPKSDCWNSGSSSYCGVRVLSLLLFIMLAFIVVFLVIYYFVVDNNKSLLMEGSHL